MDEKLKEILSTKDIKKLSFFLGVALSVLKNNLLIDEFLTEVQKYDSINAPGTTTIKGY